MRTRVLLSVALLFACACGTKAGWQLGFGSGMEMFVQRVVVRGPFLDVELAAPGIDLHIFAPANETCGTVFEPEATVVYVERGMGGRYRRGDLECDAAGVGEPLISRARRGRTATNSPVPRAQATFSVLHEDEDFVLLRGRFPLTSLIGWAGGVDSVAVVANEPVCRSPIENGVASMEFRPTGRVTLSLVGRNGLCPIVGLIRPPGNN